jgi:hypothetical protein
MEVSNGLLVAIMFVMLLSLGIVSIITALASIVNRKSDVKVSGMHLNWLVLLLLAHFNIFWHTIDILNVENWEFIGFLYTIAGPILTFFAASIIVPEGSIDDASELRDYYFRIARQFFQIFAMVQLWVLGSDLVLHGGFVPPSTLNLIVLALAVVLSISRSEGVHRAGVAVGWLIFLTQLALRGLGLFG